MEHVGFRVAIAVAGHYGLEQVCALKKSACNFMYKSRRLRRHYKNTRSLMRGVIAVIVQLNGRRRFSGPSAQNSLT